MNERPTAKYPGEIPDSGLKIDFTMPIGIYSGGNREDVKSIVAENTKKLDYERWVTLNRLKAGSIILNFPEGQYPT
jgi:hypothetical protein